MGKIKKMDRSLFLFFLLIAFVAFGNGMSDSVISNFFKDAYSVDTAQRAFLEFPRELPGLLCLVAIALFSCFGDIKTALISQLLASIGIMVLGLVTPDFGIMIIFLFIYSMGTHLFMPLSDSIGMELAEPEQLGRRVGQFGSIKTAFMFLSATLIYFGFSTNIFSFKTEQKWAFIISAISYAFAAVIAVMLIFTTKNHTQLKRRRKVKFTFKKEYKLYYFLTILNGVQKQIALVFGSWVIIDILNQGADTMSILTIVGSFGGIFFFRLVGKWIDTKGIRFVMFVDALSFIFVYVIFGLVVWGVTANFFPSIQFASMVVYTLFILDRLSMQVGIVKSVYLKSVALCPEDVTTTLSTGISLDHVVSIIAAQVSAGIWYYCGPQWVFFFAAFFSLGNVIIASRVPKDKK